MMEKKKTNKNQEIKTKGKPDSVDIHVGKRLCVRRSLLGITQEKLAEAVGITFQQIQKYEQGINRVSAGRLYQFSKILSVPISYFYEQSDNKSTMPGFADNEQKPFEGISELSKRMTDKETVKLVKAYYKIEDPELRQEVLKFINVLSSRINPKE